jgi:hypothetical protein
MSHSAVVCVVFAIGAIVFIVACFTDPPESYK